MATEAFKVQGVIEIVGDQAILNLKRIEKRGKETADSLEKGFKGVNAAIQQFMGGELASQARTLTQGFLGAASQIQGFRSTLMAVTRSAGETEHILQTMSDLAGKTRFDLPQLIDAAVKFRSMGLAVDENVKIAGTLAATYKRDLGTAVEALSKVLTGAQEGVEQLRENFAFSRQDAERLGFTVDKQGQIIVRTTADINNARIALKKFAEEKGGNILFAETENLSVAFSNVQDEIFRTSAVIGNDLAPAAMKTAKFITDLVKSVRDWDPTTRAFIGGTIAMVAAVATVGTALAPLLFTMGQLGISITALNPAVAIGVGAFLLLAKTGKTLYDSFVLGNDGVKGLTERVQESQPILERYAAVLNKTAEELAKMGVGAKEASQVVGALDDQAVLKLVDEGDVEGAKKLIEQMQEAALKARQLAKTPQEMQMAATAFERIADLSLEIGRKLVGQGKQEEGAGFLQNFEFYKNAANAARAFVQSKQEVVKATAEEQAVHVKTMADYQEEIAIIQHQLKLQQISREDARARIATILQEIKNRKDLGKTMSEEMKLEELGFDLTQDILGKKTDAVEAYMNWRKAAGQLTLEQELNLLRKERDMVGTGTEEERKKRQQLNTQIAQLDQERLKQDSDVSKKIKDLSRSEVDSKLADLRQEMVELKKHSSNRVLLEEYETARKQKIWKEEGRRRREIQADMASSQLGNKGRLTNVGISELEEKRGQGENVTEKLKAQYQEAQRLEEAKLLKEAEGRKIGLEETDKTGNQRRQIDQDTNTEIEAGRRELAIKLRDLDRDEAARTRKTQLQAKEVELDRLNLREEILKKQLDEGKNVGSLVLANLRQRYDLEIDILRAKADSDKFGKTAAERAEIEKQVQTDIVRKYQEKLQAVKDTTTEVQKQNKMQDDERKRAEDERNKLNQMRQNRVGGAASPLISLEELGLASRVDSESERDAWKNRKQDPGAPGQSKFTSIAPPTPAQIRGQMAGTKSDQIKNAVAKLKAQGKTDEEISKIIENNFGIPGFNAALSSAASTVAAGVGGPKPKTPGPKTAGGNPDDKGGATPEAFLRIEFVNPDGSTSTQDIPVSSGGNQTTNPFNYKVPLGRKGQG